MRTVGRVLIAVLGVSLAGSVYAAQPEWERFDATIQNGDGTPLRTSIYLDDASIVADGRDVATAHVRMVGNIVTTATVDCRHTTVHVGDSTTRLTPRMPFWPVGRKMCATVDLPFGER